MEEIAREANVSKATLYYYFKSKIQLFQYILQNVNGAAQLPAPDDSPPASEHDFLLMLKKRLKEGTELKSITRSLGKKPSGVDLYIEFFEIFNEIWDIDDHNRVQIIILETRISRARKGVRYLCAQAHIQPD